MNKKPTFLTFTEALSAASREPGVEFIGLGFAPPNPYLTIYSIEMDADFPDEANINFSGGDLFDLGGEEDFYDETTVPEEAKKLRYARKSELGDGAPSIMGMTSEYVLSAVLPGLNAPDMYRSEEEFAEAASAAYKAFWGAA